MVLSVIQGITLNIGVLPFSKGRTLQNGIRARLHVGDTDQRDPKGF
jgi:hypothetical protein